MLNEAVTQDKVTCTICAQVWPALAMRQHIGYHILHTRALLPSNPCGFCGGDAAQCRSWLDKQGTTVNAETRCVLLGDVAGEGKLNYNHASAKTPSAAAPCRNHLVACGNCQPEANQECAVFWSYNLRAHHESEHPSHPLPPVACVSQAERTCVKCVGGERKATVPEALKDVLVAAKEAAKEAAKAQLAQAPPGKRKRAGASS
uniref:Uncharacterized protein n=1 Tax=Prymnesium polylepis TaxID=72548 RepID=A0A7S4IEH0_9EUKA|mmetsp:Transcript_30388/g.74834  ORF Transcript_30388/g.74834 Transcript_30388/m.74834 type:complete len:203 (+) Transcript_30388:212-820(+)